MSEVTLGCGLISIGRPWGTTPNVPSETQALQFLSSAYEQGIRFFDTAPSYGTSEEVLGKFLMTLTDAERDGVTVATKFGETWDEELQAGHTDHTYDSLTTSLNRSLELLGKVDIIQLHRTTPELLISTDVRRAFDYAESLGIDQKGISANIDEVLEAVTTGETYSHLQIPYNQDPRNASFTKFMRPIEQGGKFIIINRPFQMGDIATNNTKDKPSRFIEAFSHILKTEFDGVVLTGTSNPQHLIENIEAFSLAKLSQS